MRTFIKLFLFVCFSVYAAVGQSPVVPPANAVTFYPIQQTSGWGSCDASNCAGGSGNGNYTFTQYVSSPSLSGESTQLYVQGAWNDALWFKKFGGGYDYATNMLWDFYVRLDSNASTGAQALEYDMFQFLSGYNYMIGSECNIAAGVWDTWNEATGHWVHTTIPCHGFPANTWHHIQWYVQTNHTNHTYHYVVLVVDGVAYPVNQTYQAKNIGWDHNIGCQWQLDDNASGHGYNEWFDNAKLIVW